MNYYERPAEAQFINTVTPIPFEQLMAVANVYRQEHDKSQESLRQFNKEAAEFQSLSQADTERWKNETTDRVQKIAEEMSSNPEFLKTIEGRSKINQTINSVDYGLLAKLRSNAGMLAEAAKTYDPRWGDSTMQEIANWDTAAQGMYTDRNVGYKTIGEIGNPYFDLLGKGKYIGRTADGMYDQYGITEQDLQNIVSGGAINEIYNTPEAQKHIELAKQRNQIPKDMDEREWLRRALIQAQIGRVGVVQREENKFAFENWRQSLINRRSGKSKEEEPITAPTKYDQMIVDTDSNLMNLRRNKQYFGDRPSQASSYEAEAQQELAIWKEHLDEGKITPAQFQKAVNDYTREYARRSAQDEKNFENDTTEGFRKIFKETAGIDPNTGKSNAKQGSVAYFTSAYKGAQSLVNTISVPSSTETLDNYNTKTSSSIGVINANGTPTKAYVKNTLTDVELVTTFANKLTKGNVKYNYNIKDKNGNIHNFEKMLNNGSFRNVVSVPSNLITSEHGETGAKELVQPVTIYLPLESVRNAGISDDEAMLFFKQKFGTNAVKNIGTKSITKKNVSDLLGGTSSSLWNNDVERIPQTLAGEYFTIDVVERIPRQSLMVAEMETAADKEAGGVARSGKLYDYRVEGAYDEYARRINGE